MPRRYMGRVEKTRGATSKGNNPFYSILLNKSSLHIEEVVLRARKKVIKKTSFEPTNISSIIVKNGPLSSPTLSTPTLIPNKKGLPKMQRFLQDERFRRDELPKLIEEEKREALYVNSEIDFTIKPRETVKLVAWIRFHSLYHSGKLQIRFRSDENGFVILVSQQTLILRSASDGTYDIQELKDEPKPPAFIKQLLDPYLQTEDVRNVYAFLLCDGVRWKWIGCFNRGRLSAQPPPVPPLKQPEEATSLSEEYELDQNENEAIPEQSPTPVDRPIGHIAHLPLPAPSFPSPQNQEEATPNFPLSEISSSYLKSKPVAQSIPEVVLEEYSLPEECEPEQNTSEAIPEQSSSIPAVVPKATIAKEPSTKERFNLKVVEQRRKQLKERHPYIPSNRHSIIAANSSTPLRPITSCSSDPLYILPDEIPEQRASSKSNGCDSILPGSHLNGSDFLLGTNTMQLSQYPAAEKLVMFSRQVMSNLCAVIGLKPSLNLPSSTHEMIPLAPATDTVLVASLPAPSLPSVRFGNKQQMKQRSSQIGFIIPTSTYYRPNGTMK